MGVIYIAVKFLVLHLGFWILHCEKRKMKRENELVGIFNTKARNFEILLLEKKNHIFSFIKSFELNMLT